VHPPRMRSLLVALVLVGAVSCVPHRDLTVAQIAASGSLSEIMDAQATIADPEWSKIGKAGYTDADWAALEDMATRLQATSAKAKEFSKGPGFDVLALQLHTHAEELHAAFAAKSEAGASAALQAMKATCKECHSKFR
jgi:cytochrome c556